MHLLAREETGLRCLLQVALHARSGTRASSRPDPSRNPETRRSTSATESANPAPPLPIAQIASAEGLSDVYAAKLMRQLRLAGLVESTRGAAGGYRLSRDAESISVWDAIRALDESFLPGASCDCRPEERLDCRRTTTCAVTSLWRRLGRDIRESLEAVSLADLCAGALEQEERLESTSRTTRIELPVTSHRAVPSKHHHTANPR